MLTIRPEQLRAFEDGALAQFATDNALRLARTYGPWCAAIGDAALRATVDHGIARAEARGVVADAAIERWLDLCVLLGSGFADDPLLPWANAWLADTSLGDPDARVQRTYDHAQDWLQRTAGVDGRHTTSALYRVVTLPSEQWTPRGGLEVGTLALVAELDPSKHEALAQAGLLPRLLARARAIASAASLTDDRGFAIVAAASFMLGSGFPTDPQLPWASTALRSPPPHRAETLLREAKALANRVLRAIAKKET